MASSFPTIFVQIASYRDPECQWTVKDLFEKAAYPDRVTVGICWQWDPKLDAACFQEPSPRPLQTKISSVLPQESQGVCWARAVTQQLFEDQDYVLMIDSHMRFIKNWDTELIAELKRCPSKKSFLSTYPPGYTPPDNLEPNPRPIIMRAQPFSEAGDIRFEGEVLAKRPEKPLRGAFLAAGLLFAPGSFVREVPYDPYIYFNQEEITLAARAFTHGWDVYAPTKAFVYHYYNEPKKDTGPARALHWKDRKDWSIFQKLSMQRARYLLAGETPENPEALNDLEVFALGAERTLKEFEEFSGIDFKKKVATERARRAQFIDNLDDYRAPKKALPETRKLKVGDLLQPFPLKDAGGTEWDWKGMAGKAFILCALPSNFDTYVQHFLEQVRLNQARFEGVPIVLAAPVEAGELAAYALRNAIDREIFADDLRAMHRCFGLEARVHDTPVSAVLDKRHMIYGIYDNRNSLNHIADLMRAAEMARKVS